MNIHEGKGFESEMLKAEKTQTTIELLTNLILYDTYVLKPNPKVTTG